MSASVFQPNASLPPPSLTECAEFEDRARKMLHRAWDNPKELGEESEICREATSLLAEIRQHCSPRDELDKPNPARENFHNALKLAWLAVWRARDYSANALAKRSREKKWRQPFDRLDVMHGLYEFGGVAWFAHHFPLVDQNGNLTDRSRLDFKRPFDFQRDAEYQEGSMISDPNQLVPFNKTVLAYAYVDTKLAPLENGVGLVSCFLTGAPIEIRYESGGLANCVGVIAFTPLTISNLDFSDPSLLQEGRFEEGLTLNGGFTETLDCASIEAGRRLRIENSTLKADLDLSRAPGVTCLHLKTSFIKGQLKIVGRSSFTLRVEGGAVNSVDAQETTFDSLEVNGWQVSSTAKFDGTIVRGRCSFQETVFGGVASFKAAYLGIDRTLASVKPGASMEMRTCRFLKSADFTQATFWDSHFEGSSFADDASFRGSSFLWATNFRTTTWSGRVDFSRFEGHSTVFTGAFDISHHDAELPDARMPWCSFVGAHFEGSARLQNRKFVDETWFDGATFRAAPEFHGSKLHSKTFFSGTRFLWARTRPSKWIDRAIVARSKTLLQGEAPADVSADARKLLDVVNCFRVLNSLATEIDAKDLAYQFHKEELRAKYRLPIGNGVSRPEAFVGRVYGLLADYGDSFVRPIAALFVSIALFAFLYALPYSENNGRWSSGVATSAALQFRPVAALDPSFGRLPSPEDEWLCNVHVGFGGSISTECLQYHLRRDHELWTKACSTAQTLLTFVFLFLALLALRRKYQVS